MYYVFASRERERGGGSTCLSLSTCLWDTLSEDQIMPLTSTLYQGGASNFHPFRSLTWKKRSDIKWKSCNVKLAVWSCSTLSAVTDKIFIYITKYLYNFAVYDISSILSFIEFLNIIQRIMTPGWPPYLNIKHTDTREVQVTHQCSIHISSTFDE